MIDLRWAYLPGTNTEPPQLQWRCGLAVDASGAFCPGEWTEWRPVPVAIVPKDSESRKPG